MTTSIFVEAENRALHGYWQKISEEIICKMIKTDVGQCMVIGKLLECTGQTDDNADIFRCKIIDIVQITNTDGEVIQ